MTNLLEIDTNEPETALGLLAPVVPAQRITLNAYGYADYKWVAASGRVTQVERKTWPEILGSVDKVEDQLRRHKANQPNARLIFMLEGMVDVSEEGVFTVKKTHNGRVWVRGYRAGIPIGRVYSFLYNVSEYLEVFQTMDFTGSMQFLACAYKQDQKEEAHDTLGRYYKEVTHHHLPQVQMLMGMIENLGPKRAEAIIDRFVTVWNVFNASQQELQTVSGIGPVLARTILQRIGRPDV